MKIRVGALVLGMSCLFLTCGYVPLRATDDGSAAIMASLPDPIQQHRCLRALEAGKKWVPKLKLSDWDIELHCGVPDEWKDKSEGLHGASSIDAPHRKGIVWFNPASEKDPELVIIHELTHFVIQEVVESKSLMIEERAVYTLSELMYAGKDN